MNMRRRSTSRATPKRPDAGARSAWRSPNCAWCAGSTSAHPHRGCPPHSARPRLIGDGRDCHSAVVERRDVKPISFGLRWERVLIAACGMAVLADVLPAPARSAEPASQAVPFVSCAGDGQTGPVAATADAGPLPRVPPAQASALAYYAFRAVGVLAPLGWHCFALYGSSGRFEVAKVAARLFPVAKPYVRDVIAEGIEPDTDFEFAPYPADSIHLVSSTVAEFTTPAGGEGLGTQGSLAADDQPVVGVAIWLPSENHDMVLLSTRLPPDQGSLARTILVQTERTNGAPGAAAR